MVWRVKSATMYLRLESSGTGSSTLKREPVPDDLNCEHPSNQAKKLLNDKKLPKSLAVSFLFINFAPTFASCPTRLGFWANRVWLRICLYLWESVFMRFVSDSLKSGQFQSQSELSNGRCSCSVYTWFYARKADYSNGLPLCVIEDYINSTAWVLRCLFNRHG